MSEFRRQLRFGSSSAGAAIRGLAIALLLSGCPSVSTMQTTKTTPKGLLRVGLQAGLVGLQPKRQGTSYSHIEPGASPMGELQVRYGVSDDFDIGIKGYAGGGELAVKYLLLDSDLDIAFAPSVGLTGYEGYGRATLLFGLDFSHVFNLNFGGKFDIRTPLRDNAVGLGSPYVGGFLNFFMYPGDHIRAGPEINVMTNVGDDAFSKVIFQAGYNLMVDWGASESL